MIRKTIRRVLVIAIVIGGCLYLSDTFMFRFLDSVEDRVSGVVGREDVLRVNGIRNQLFKLVDEVNPFARHGVVKRSDLTEVRLTLSPNDVRYFEEAFRLAIASSGTVLPSEATKKRSIQVSFDGKKSDGTLSLHGDAYNHYAFYKKSFKVAFREQFPAQQFTDWRLLIPDDRGYLSPFVSHELSRRLGLPVADHRFAKVYINDIFYGLYFLEEKYDEAYLERNGFGNYAILKKDNVRVKRQLAAGDVTATLDQFDVDGLDDINHLQAAGIRDQAAVLFDAIAREDHETLKTFFDVELTGKVEAWRALLGKTHDISPGNARFAYNVATGKVFILPRLETGIHERFDSVGGETGKLLRFFELDPDIVRERDAALRDIIANKASLLTFYDELEAAYASLIKRDKTISRGSRVRVWDMQQQRAAFEDNLAFWEEHLFHEREIATGTPLLRPANLTFGSLSFVRKGDEYVLPVGNYTIHNTLFLPAGYHFRILAGTRIRIAPGVSVISYSPMTIQGDRRNPVSIGSLTRDPYGVFAIQGVDHPTCATTITHLESYGGSEAFVDGVFYSGGLNIYECDVVMQHTHVHTHAADDGLNVKYAAVSISNNTFRDNAADQVDLDYVSGDIRENVFVGQGGINGDGLDLSGARATIAHNEFTGFDDKGISVGEQSTVHISHNNIHENTTGIAAKDLSHVYVDKNAFSDNIMDIHAYQKKAMFGGAHVFFVDTTSTISIDTDKRSSASILPLQAYEEAVATL